MSAATLAQEALDGTERDAIAVGLAAGMRRSVDALEPGVVRRWWRLVATETFDAWLIDWPEGTEVPRHDHDGASASICVVRGRLIETRYGAGSASSSTLRPGAVHRVAADASHRIANLGDVPASSVHVYSPPLTAMGFYDPDGAPLRHDPVDPAPTLWSVELP